MTLLEDFLEAGFENKIEQDSVLLEFGAFGGLDEIHRLDIRLFDEIPSEIGRHDGHEVAFDESHGTLFTYGNNAEKLFKAMQPILNDFPFLNGARVYLTFRKKDKTTSELEFDYSMTN